MRTRFYIALTALVTNTYSPLSFSGPPLTVEDPGILDAGQWEIIAATTASSVDGLEFYQAPSVDLSLGVLADTLQVSASLPYVYLDVEDGDRESDFGNLSLGLKWQFWASDRIKLALAPGYAFGLTRELAEIGIGSDGNVAVLPLAMEYQIDDRWRLNTVVEYVSIEQEEDSWGYGTAVIYLLNDRWELMGELAGSANSNLGDHFLTARVGFDFAIAPDLHLLVSAATGVHEPDSAPPLDFDFYLGLKFLL